MSAQQVLRGAAETVSVAYYDADGVLTDPGTVTIGIVNAAGATVQAAGTATSGSGQAARTYSLTPTHTASLDRLTLTWTSATLGVRTTDVEVAGAYLFTVAEARAWGAKVNGAYPLQSASDYPAATIEEARARITEEIEGHCKVSFVPRYEREMLDGNGSRCLLLPHYGVTGVRAIETRDVGAATWTAFDADELADVSVDPIGELVRELLGTFPAGRRNVRVGYEHGWQAPPLAIKRAALDVLLDQLPATNVSRRALQEASEFGTIQLARQDSSRGWYFGLPHVDSVIGDYYRRLPGEH